MSCVTGTIGLRLQASSQNRTSHAACPLPSRFSRRLVIAHDPALDRRRIDEKAILRPQPHEIAENGNAIIRIVDAFFSPPAWATRLSPTPRWRRRRPENPLQHLEKAQNRLDCGPPRRAIEMPALFFRPRSTWGTRGRRDRLSLRRSSVGAAFDIREHPQALRRQPSSARVRSALRRLLRLRRTPRTPPSANIVSSVTLSVRAPAPSIRPMASPICRWLAPPKPHGRRRPAHRDCRADIAGRADDEGIHQARLGN